MDMHWPATIHVRKKLKFMYFPWDGGEKEDLYYQCLVLNWLINLIRSKLKSMTFSRMESGSDYNRWPPLKNLTSTENHQTSANIRQEIKICFWLDFSKLKFILLSFPPADIVPMFAECHGPLPNLNAVIFIIHECTISGTVTSSWLIINALVRLMV